VNPSQHLGLIVGELESGPNGDITDVDGVEVGHTTLASGEGSLVRGVGPVRTGVTVILPGSRTPWETPIPAGGHRLNGNGEMTGMAWLDDGGFLSTPIALTNTHSVGIVRDALIAYEWEHRGDDQLAWSMPVVGETYDGVLSDINGFHVAADHVHQAIANAATGPIDQGAVGGGTGMICHEFKGGIGSASRKLPKEAGGWTVGALVQANHGRRSTLRVGGRPVGQRLSAERVPSAYADLFEDPPGTGSIIVVLATDAPLLPLQCQRVARRATIGLARTGGGTEESSGDLFLCFATGNLGRYPKHEYTDPGPLSIELSMVVNAHLTALFEAAADSVEEAIVNALLAAETTTGRDGRITYGLDSALLLKAMGEDPTV
jgi:D-aminopeptidase